jgi:hypothetical protein
MFISTLLGKGDSMIEDVATQDLGSMINKCPVEVDCATLGVLTLDQAIHSVLEERLLKIAGNIVPQDPSEMTNNNTWGVNLGDIHDDIRVQTQAVIAMAWDLGQRIISRACGNRFFAILVTFQEGNFGLHFQSNDKESSKTVQNPPPK